MKKIITLLLCVTMIASLVACGTKTEERTEEKAIDVTGNWIGNPPSSLGYIICLYEGGSGKGYETKEQFDEKGSYYALTYEIKDNVININNTGFPDGMGIIGFKLEDDKLISVDGEITYIRYQE